MLAYLARGQKRDDDVDGEVVDGRVEDVDAGNPHGSGERKAVKMNKKRRNEMATEIAEIKEMKEMLGQMVEEMSGWIDEINEELDEASGSESFTEEVEDKLNNELNILEEAYDKLGDVIDILSCFV